MAGLDGPGGGLFSAILTSCTGTVEFLSNGRCVASCTASTSTPGHLVCFGYSGQTSYSSIYHRQHQLLCTLASGSARSSSCPGKVDSDPLAGREHGHAKCMPTFLRHNPMSTCVPRQGIHVRTRLQDQGGVLNKLQPIIQQCLPEREMWDFRKHPPFFLI